MISDLLSGLLSLNSLPVPAEAACSDQLGRPDRPGCSYDGGVKCCNNKARHTEPVPSDMCSMAVATGAEQGGGGCDGVSYRVMVTTAVLPLQSKLSVCSTWEQGEKALEGSWNSAHASLNSEYKQDQPNLGAGWADTD